MANINLLPWREELRVQRNKEFGIVAGVSAGLGVLIIVGLTLYYNNLIDNQKSRNNYMQTEIAKLDKKIKEIKNLKAKKERLLQRIRTIQDLQTNRTEIVHLFDEVARQMPEGVYLNGLKQQGSRVEVRGVAQSSTRVSALMRQVDASDWMADPEVDRVETTQSGNSRQAEFVVYLKQISQGAEDEELLP